MGPELKTEEASNVGQNTESKAGDSYNAVVYFHGMGAPRRHEEISRLTDALDQFAITLDVGSVGRLRSQKVVFEPSRCEEDEDVAYVGINRVVRRFGDSYRVETKLRIYEGYWSPYAVGGYSWLIVLAWMIAKLANPIKVLAHNWRAHQRLKIATLHRIFDRNVVMERRRAFYRIEKLYVEYENWAARRIEPKGSFAGFLRHISRHVSADDPAFDTIVALAREWRRQFFLEQLRLIFFVFTVIAAVIDAVLLLAIFAFPVANYFGLAPANAQDYLLLPVGATFPLVAILPFVAIKTRYYLSTFWADVMFWTTQEEKDDRFSRRKEILNASIRALTHVLRDPLCKRIVVVGHSLGSAIAFESLLKLGRRRNARSGGKLPLELERLDLITHFVTIGSPIDWTHYFFELHDSRYHRYNRIRDELKGSTGDAPFKIDGRSSTQWINIWDKADPISTEVFSPRGRLQNFGSIQNIETMSSHLSKPIEAHSAYFSSDASMRAIFWLSIFGRLPKPGQEVAYREYQSKLVNIIRGFQYGSGILVAWAVLLNALIYMLRPDSYVGLNVALAAQVGLVVLQVIFIIVYAVAKVADQVWPLRINAPAIDPATGPRIP